MLIIYRIILLFTFLTLPVWGAEIKDVRDIVNNFVKPVCINHKLVCTVRVVEIDRPLAFTQYNNITLSTNVVKRLNKDELRSVLAHETAHAVLRHSTLGQNYIIKTFTDKGRQPTEQEIKKYRHKVEYEADSYSTILLYQYGYKNKLPEALSKLTIKKYSEESLTHPSDRDRINNIRNLQRILK